MKSSPISKIIFLYISISFSCFYFMPASAEDSSNPPFYGTLIGDIDAVIKCRGFVDQGNTTEYFTTLIPSKYVLVNTVNQAEFKMSNPYFTYSATGFMPDSTRIVSVNNPDGIQTVINYTGTLEFPLLPVNTNDPKDNHVEVLEGTATTNITILIDNFSGGGCTPLLEPFEIAPGIKLGQCKNLSIYTDKISTNSCTSMSQ